MDKKYYAMTNQLGIILMMQGCLNIEDQSM